MKTLKKPSLCEIPSRDSIFRTRQLGRDLRRFLAQPLAESRVRCKARMLKALSCQVLRASRDGACPASLASLCALAFPSIQLESPGSNKQHWGAWLCLLDTLPTGWGRLLWEPLDVSIIQAQQAQLPQAPALTILVASAWTFPSLFMSGWNLGVKGGDSVVLQTVERTEGYNLFPQSFSCAPLGATQSLPGCQGPLLSP